MLLTIIFSKTLATQLFFTDHLNHKTVNKTTWRTPSANPRQLWVHLLKSFRTVAIIFWGFQDFLIHLAKHVWSLLKLEYSTIFLKTNVNKTVRFLYVVSLKCIEIITVKLYFVVKSLKSKKKKLALTSIYYVNWEIWVGNSKNFICTSGFYIFSYPQQFKNV